MSSSTLSMWSIGLSLFGGLALFLFGMEHMSTALKAAAGDRMKTILERFTKRRLTAVLAGAAVTAVIQSSSVTTVLVVGFVSAGLMTMTQSIGIIMGANIGTTMTAQIVAFKITEAALPMIAVGFGMAFFSKRDAARHWGGLILGLGLVFFGMSVMSDAMKPLRTYQPFLDLMVNMERPLLGMLVGAAFTALVQSSSATTGIVIVMASQGFMTLPAGIAVALGANIGTCVTALLAAVGKPREAVRAALVHVVFNVGGAALWIAFIPQLAELASLVSPTNAALAGTERLAAETPRQIANANTIFNVVNTLAFLGFARPLARLVTRLAPDRPPEKGLVRPRFLDEAFLVTPALALDRVRMEFGHMGELVLSMWGRVREALAERDRAGLREVERRDDDVDTLHEEMLGYLGRIRRQRLDEEDAEQLLRLMSATDTLESAADVVELDFVALGNEMLDRNIRPSETMRKALAELGETVVGALGTAIGAVRDRDPAAAHGVLALKGEVNARVAGVLEHQASKLGVEDPKRLSIFRAEMGVVDGLKRTYSLAKRIARQALPVEARREAA